MSSQKWRNGMTDIGLVIRKYIVYGRWFVIARLYVQIPMRYRKITGLTQVWPSADVLENNQYRLVIPNLEIRKLFIRQIREWFRDVSRKDGETLDQFCEAFPEQNPKKIEEIFSDYLWNTISIRDTASSKKENFYHGIACYKKNCKVVLGWCFYDKSIQDKQETFAASWIFLYFE